MVKFVQISLPTPFHQLTENLLYKKENIAEKSTFSKLKELITIKVQSFCYTEPYFYDFLSYDNWKCISYKTWTSLKYIDIYEEKEGWPEEN